MPAFEIDPITGRYVPVVETAGDRLRRASLLSGLPTPQETAGDRMRAGAAASADARYVDQRDAPPSPRPFTGPGDGAPMFPDQPMVAPPVGGMSPEDEQAEVAQLQASGQVGPTNAPVPPAGALSQEPAQAPGASPYQSPAVSSALDRLRVGPTPSAPAPSAPAAARPGALSAPTAQPTPAAPAGEDPFEAQLYATESGGDASRQNALGYTGLGQFGAPRLQTLGFYQPGQGENLSAWGRRGDNRWTGTFNIPGFEDVRTIEDFRRNPAAQRAVYQAHMQDIDRAIDAIPGAEAFNRNGLRAVAHLGGNDGMRRFVESGGQHNPSDANGTRLSDYYTRFSGSDAPPGAQGRMGGTSPVPAAQPAASAPEDMAKPEATAPAGPAGQSRGILGMSPEAWFGLSAGLFGGRNLSEGLSRGLTAMNTQTRADQTRTDAAANRSEARADRRQNASETAAYRRAQLGLAQQRIGLQTARQDGTTTRIQGQPQPMLDPQTGTAYVLTTTQGGTPRVTDLSGNPVTDQAVLGRLMRPQDSGDAAARGAQARADVEFLGDIRTDVETTRASAQAASNLREVLRQNPELVGASWRDRGSRTVAQALGIQVDGKTPQQIDAAMRNFSTLEANEIRRMSALFRPMSDTDVRTILRNVPTMDSSPENIQAWLTEVDRAHRRAIARADFIDRSQADPARSQAIRRSEGGWRRAVSEFDRQWDADNRNPPSQPNIQADPNTGGFTARTRSGVGYSFQ